MDVRTIAVTTHGRYLVSGPATSDARPPAPGSRFPSPTLVGFHGYSENAERHLEVLRRIAGERPWRLISVQALNRFYTRTNDAIAASWMTREDRELAIADNIAYVSSVLDAVEQERGAPAPLVCVGFSQGVAMAYRAALFAGRPCAGLILLAGDVPPDVGPLAGSLPPVLLGRGTADTWYTAKKAAADVAALTAAGTSVTEFVFEGGHVWDDAFVARAGAFLDELTRR